jgi:hypothetical protein
MLGPQRARTQEEQRNNIQNPRHYEHPPPRA